MRGQSPIMMGVIGVILCLVVVFTVVQPIINSAAATNQSLNIAGNLTSYNTAQTIVTQMPVFAVLTGLACLAALVMGAFM